VGTTIFIYVRHFRRLYRETSRCTLGNIRPTYIKRVAIELLRQHPDAFTTDFEHNKVKVSELTDVSTTMMRNRIAGYVTRYRRLVLAQAA